MLNGISDFGNVTLGIVACGTGNDFIRASGHPRKVKDAMDVILKGETGYIDYIDVGSRRCLNVAGAGMDVDVLIRYAEMKAFHGKSSITPLSSTLSPMSNGTSSASPSTANPWIRACS